MEASYISTGDGLVAIKSGWGHEYGIAYGRPSSGITVRRVRGSSPFSGVAIGSEACATSSTAGTACTSRPAAPAEAGTNTEMLQTILLWYYRLLRNKKKAETKRLLHTKPDEDPKAHRPSAASSAQSTARREENDPRTCALDKCIDTPWTNKSCTGGKCWTNTTGRGAETN
jgi:hypothetical protein